jgi:Trk-type K+ transport system membrane component
VSLRYASGARTFASPLGFAAFTAVSAFSNCGLSLRPAFHGHINPSMLLVVNVLALAGNTFFPILLRWTLIFLSRFSADDSNRKGENVPNTL